MSRKNKRAHLDDFQLDEDGAYHYQGTLWHWQSTEKRTTFLRTAWLLLGAAAGCVLAAGFVPASGVGNAFTILMPYVVSLIGIALSGYSLLVLTREGDAVRDYLYRAHVERLEPKLLLGLVASVACAVGEIAYLLMHGEGALVFGYAALYVALMLASGLCLGVLVKQVQVLSFTAD